MSGSRPISFFSARGLADTIFVVIGLWSNQVLRYSVVARHIFLWLAYQPVRLFSARNRAYQSFSLSHCRPFKLLVLEAQSMRFSLLSSWPMWCFHVGIGGNQTFLRCKFCPFHWGFCLGRITTNSRISYIAVTYSNTSRSRTKEIESKMLGSQQKLFSSIDMLVTIYGGWCKSNTLIKRRMGSGGL